MSSFDVDRDRYQEGLHAGAGKSLKLTIGSLQDYLVTGNLPRVGTDKGLRKQQNELMHHALQIAAQRGVQQERQRIARLLELTLTSTIAADESYAEDDETVIPLRRRRMRCK